MRQRDQLTGLALLKQHPVLLELRFGLGSLAIQLGDGFLEIGSAG